MPTKRFYANKDVPVRGQIGKTFTNSKVKQGSPGNRHLFAGKLGNRQHKSFIDFSFDFSGVGKVTKAELVLTTSEVTFEVYGAAYARIYRVKHEFQEEGNGTGWTDRASIAPGAFTGQQWRGEISPTAGVKSRIDVLTLIGLWLNGNKTWEDDGGSLKNGAGKPRHGIRVDASRMGNRDYAFEFRSSEAPSQTDRPYIEITYELPNQPPDMLSTITPNGTVLPGTPFTGEYSDPNNDIPNWVRVIVRKVSTDKWVWGSGKVPYDPTWVEAGGIYTWSIENPVGLAGGLIGNTDYKWRAEAADPDGKEAPVTDWREFRMEGTVSTATMRTLGSLETLAGYYLEADWSVDPSSEIISYRIQLRRDVDPWTMPLWDEAVSPLSSEEKSLQRVRRTYSGPTLDAGDYQVRVKVFDSLGVASAWSADEPLTLTVGSGDWRDDGSGQPPNITGYARQAARVRILLQEVDVANERRPGKVVGIIEDAANIGVSAYANDPGELFFTLSATHPQAGVCEPYQTHYSLQQYRNGNWADISNGILTDFDAGDEDIVIYGIDYLGLLSLSIDTRYPPGGTNTNAEHKDGGAKYKKEAISDIITDQLREAKNDTDSPLSFFRIGNIDTLDNEITIYSSFIQRLQFIKSLLQSERAGSGKRTRLRARQDPSQNDRWEWDLRKSPGIDRDNLRLEYGSLVQGFRVIGMGDFATRAHGMGVEPLSVKPRYHMFPGDGDSDGLTSVFGNIQRVNVWEDIVDTNDLKRRVKQMYRESSKVGKRIALGLRVHGIDPFDGYDLTDNIPVDIVRGLVDTSRYGSGYWTIWGIEWRIFPDGHDELTWSILPREDSTPPDSDLIPSDPIHQTAEWALGNGPPPPEPALASVNFYLDVDTGTVYERTLEVDDYVGWTKQVELPAIPPPPGGWYPGDGVPPSVPTDFVVMPTNMLNDDGTVSTVLEATWTNASEPDIIGYELQWDYSDPDPNDPDGTVIPADWLDQQVFRADTEAQRAVLQPVLGGRGYEVRIRAYDMEGFQSPWVYYPRVVASPDDSAPDIPDGLSAVGGYKLLSAYWGASEAPDLSYYQLRYRVAGEPDWTILDVKSNRVTVSDLDGEVTYEVEVRAVDRSGNVRVSGSPDVGDEVIDGVTNEDVGWSVMETATTTLVGSGDVAVHTLAAEFIWTGVLDADRVVTGDLSVGGINAASVIRMYDSIGRPIAAQGEFGLIMVDPDTTGRAMWLTDGLLQFTSDFDYQGDPLELGIPGTSWTLGIGPDGINAEAITFGSQFGGNNRVLNAGFELRSFDTATLESIIFSDSTDWGSPLSNINMDVSGTELRMVSI